MIMNNEPVEENSKPAVSDKSKTDVMRSRLAKIHMSSELLRTSNRISEIRARQIAVFPLQKRYATQIGQIRERNAARCRELIKVVQKQNRFIDSAAIQNLSLPKIDSINFEIPVFSNQFSASLDVIGEALDNFLGSVNKTIPLEAFNLFNGLTKKIPRKSYRSWQ